MAEAIMAEVVSVILEKLGSGAYKQILFAKDLDSHIKRLQELKTTIEATFLDAASLESWSNAQRDVLDKLNHALAELDDFLDEKTARAKQQEIIYGNKFVKAIRSFFSQSSPLVTPLRDANKLKGIIKKFERIARDHAQFGAIVSIPSVSQARALSTETTWSQVITDVVIGRDGDRDSIVSILSEDSESLVSETLSVASIVGIGGVGKTTLAQYVYHDERLKSCFDVQFWVSTNQNFEVKEVVEKILESSSDEMPFGRKVDRLYNQFLTVIGGKKYLLVLDNICEQDGLRLKWLKLRNLLAVGAKGSKVLITTRFSTVAGIMDSVAPYMIGDLTERDSWLLFQKIAFTQWQEPGVEAIGEEIAKMCMNVPLVIRSIGGLLAGKQTLQEWETFRDDQLKHFSSYGRDVIQTLKLSFDQLDARQKLCVAYCSLFPKGFEYDEDQMVRLWISLGYVEPQYRSQSLEEAAGAYMLNLVNCGFFKIEQTYDFGTGVRLTMHNMMHDLVLSVSGFRYKMADSDTREFDEQVRHLSFGGTISESWEVPSSLFKIEHLQSFLLVVSRHCKLTLKNLSINDRSILRLKSLRILDLHRLGLKIVPRSLGELQCLRYLNLSYNPMVKLPNSITRLVNLLSLDLFGCHKLEELPKNMSRLVKLRHLKVGYCNALSHIPKGLGSLTDLRRLDMFVQGEQNSENGSKAKSVGGLGELNRLNNLMGKLTIRVFGRSMDTVSEAKAANLKSKDRLLGLDLEFIGGSLKHDEIFIEGLQLNSNLRELLIYGYAGQRLPSWMLDRLHFWLPNLVSIWILQCEGCRCLCSFGRLPHLKNLNLLDLDNVEYIETTCARSNESNSNIVYEHHAPLFPSLEYLWLRNMPKFKGWKRIISNSEADSRQPTQNNLLERKLAFPRLKHMQVDKMEWVLLITGEFRGFTLEQLTVSRCEDLNAIPEWTTNLSSLKTLTLENCSKKLEERCLKPTGEDWPKIQHIPTIRIFGSGGTCLQLEYFKGEKKADRH